MTQTEAAQLARTMASTMVRRLVDSSQRGWPEDMPMLDADDEDQFAPSSGESWRTSKPDRLCRAPGPPGRTHGRPAQHERSTMSGTDNDEEPTGWRRLLHTTDLGQEVTIARLSAITGLSRATISKQLGKGRWNIATVGRGLGQGGPHRYPTAPILEWAAGPGKGNRTRGDVRRQAALMRVASVLTTGFVAPALQAIGHDPDAYELTFDVSPLTDDDAR